MIDKTPAPIEKPVANSSRVLLYMNVSMLMFTSVGVFGKDVMNREVGGATFIEFTFVRMVFMVILAYSYLLKLKIKVTDVPPNLWPLLLARCFIGSINFIILAVVIKIIPLTI